MRKEIDDYLREDLRLTLSLEKTKVTHLNEGFDFLGFHRQRCRGHRGLVTKRTIPDQALKKHRGQLRAATAPGTHHDSVRIKLLALNRIIGGWCRYYQYTSKASSQFAKMEHETFWRVAHWLARKHQWSLPATLARFDAVREGSASKTLGVDKVRLARHGSYPARRYYVSPFKPNPYTTQERVLEREELLDDDPWLGHERRPGMADLRPIVLERDGHKCCAGKEAVTNHTAQVDHVRPVSSFKRPVDANHLGNLWTLCIPCHKRKTEMDRQRESRMP